jgi:N-acetylglucosaminyldiphosphoundecaprenol N-acetyl-beta-D-mannosaminyltransferase
MHPTSRSLNILGVPVTPFDSFEAAVDYVGHRITEGQKTFCVAINPEKIQSVNRDPALRRAVDASNLQICDGIGVVLAALLLYGRKLARCTGVDLFIEVARLAEAKHLRVFLLGGTLASNAGARRKLLELFPGLQVAGWRDGYFKDSEEVVNEVNSSKADILFVALGSPRQELWIAENLTRLHANFCMGVGGTFDVMSGIAKRAPLFFRRTGTEWLFRLVMQPQRIRRQLAYPVFAMRVLKEKLAS